MKAIGNVFYLIAVSCDLWIVVDHLVIFLLFSPRLVDFPSVNVINGVVSQKQVN